MIAKATDAQLTLGFETDLRETEGQMQRVEQVFSMHGLTPKAVDCPAIDGILRKPMRPRARAPTRSVLDAPLPASAQAVEHYEITRYGTLVAWAKELGRTDCAAVLQHNFNKECGGPKNDCAGGGQGERAGQ